MSAADLLKRLPQALNAGAATGIDCTIQFACSQPTHVSIRDGQCQVTEGTATAPDLTITMDDDDLIAMLKGELNGMSAFMQGKLQVDGDLLLAQRIPALFDSGKFLNPSAATDTRIAQSAPAFLIEASDEGLQLRARHHPEFKPLRCDWTAPEVLRRIAAGRKQLLPRAIGLHKQPGLSVLDATAGLGRDGCTLAALGAQVTMAEREPHFAQLLADARERALQDPRLRAAALRTELIAGDARALLLSGRRWDVVHLDPMYPHQGRHALPQKEMQLLRELTGGDVDADALLTPALAAATLRVVVKRPRVAGFLDGRVPSFQLEGTQARYDVYLVTAGKGKRMRLLTLVRHAKSSWADAELSDFERPLNERGRRDAPRMAAHLHERIGIPDRIISSPALRAITTARVFAAQFGIADDAVQHDARIYEATPDTLLRIVNQLEDEDQHVMLFGHNPGFSELAHRLATCPFEQLPTCAAVHLALPIEHWWEVAPRCAVLRDYRYPKALSD